MSFKKSILVYKNKNLPGKSIEKNFWTFFVFGLVITSSWCYNSAKFIQLSPNLR